MNRSGIIKFRVLTALSITLLAFTLYHCNGGGGDDSKEADKTIEACICENGKTKQNPAQNATVCSISGTNCPFLASPSASPSGMSKAMEQPKAGAIEKGAETLKGVHQGIDNVKDLLGPKGVEIQKTNPAKK